MVCVWPPQISINTQGLVAVSWISCTSARAMRASRYSSMYFMFHFREGSEVFEKTVRSFRLIDINPADRKTNVHHYIVADLSFWNEIQADAPDNATKLHLA